MTMAGAETRRDSRGAPCKRAAWLLGGTLLVLFGAKWGTEVGTTRRIRDLEERLRLLEAEQLEWRRRAEQREEREEICITSVHSSGAGWRFFRADGSEAAFIEVEVRNSTPLDAAAVAARRATEIAAQCVVNITVAESTGSLEVHRLSGEVVELQACRAEHEADERPSYQNVTDRPGDSVPAGGGQMQLASELMRAPAHALLPAAPAQGVQEVGQSSASSELACDGLGSEVWTEVKSATASLFGSWRTGVEVRDNGQLQALVNSAVQRLSGQSAGDCSTGRLCMSLLAVLVGGTGGQLLGAHAIHSPLLTALLDTPWRLLVRSGWPVFGMLAQLHLRVHQKQKAPTVGRAAEYFQDLWASLEWRDSSALGDEPRDVARVAYLGASFLRSDEGRAHASTYVIPGLCALASQLLSPEVGTAGMPVDDALEQVQGFFRQAVQSIEDLQGTLDSAWPLYSVLHLAALQLGGQ